MVENILRGNAKKKGGHMTEKGKVVLIQEGRSGLSVLKRETMNKGLVTVLALAALASNQIGRIWSRFDLCGTDNSKSYKNLRSYKRRYGRRA